MALLCGWLLALAVSDAESGHAGVRAPAPGPPGRGPAAPAAEAWSQRELRALPGIGPARALAIVERRWDQGGRFSPDVWEQVPGIGPETAAAARAALRAGSVEASRRAPYTPGTLP